MTDKPDIQSILQQMQMLADQLANAGAAANSAAPMSTLIPLDAGSQQVYYAPPATYRVKDGVTLAIDGEKPHWISTNATGAMALRLSNGENTVADIAERIAERYRQPLSTVLSDTAAYLETLSGIEYVSQSPRLAPTYRGRGEAIKLGRLADLFLFVTNDCNLRCTHCYVSSGDYVPPREMTADEIYSVIDQARELGVTRFLVTGGEPFMVRDIYDIVRYITAESDLVLLTNAMFLTEKNIERLEQSKGSGSIAIQVSLDGPTADLHNAIRGKGAFERTTSVIPRLIAHGFSVTISTAVSLHTVDHMADMTRLVHQLGCSEHHILWMQEWGRAVDNKPELMISPARMVEVMRTCRQVADELGITIDNDASLRVRVRGKHGRKTDLCSCAWDSLAVFSDGQVYPCVWMAGAPGLECGNVLQQPLEQIWRESPMLDEVRGVSVQNREQCSDCHLKYICAGGSPCSSHFGSLASKGKGDFHAAEPYCETFMALTHDMLWELGLAGVETRIMSNGYEAPRLYNAMEGAGAKCARPNTTAVDRAFEVGSYHCVCVLESDVAEGVAFKPVVKITPIAQANDPYAATVSFDAMGESCVELLLPMAKMVRALQTNQILKVVTDDPGAREDLGAWCRMTGNELLERVKSVGYDSYFIRRGSSM